MFYILCTIIIKIRLNYIEYINRHNDGKLLNKYMTSELFYSKAIKIITAL